MTSGKRSGFKAYNPIKEIDWNRVDRLLEAGCTAHEIAADQNVFIGSFYTQCLNSKGCKWSDYKTIKRDCGKGELRLVQHSKATSGSDTMLKWLGEHRLGQVPKVNQTAGIGKITIVVKYFVVDSSGVQQEILKNDPSTIREPDIVEAPFCSNGMAAFADELDIDKFYEIHGVPDAEEPEPSDSIYVETSEVQKPGGYKS